MWSKWPFVAKGHDLASKFASCHCLNILHLVTASIVCILSLPQCFACCHCLIVLHFVTASMFCISSLPQCFAFCHCLIVLHVVTASLCCILSLPRCFASCHCLNVLHFVTASLCCMLSLPQCCAFCHCLNVLHFVTASLFCISFCTVRGGQWPLPSGVPRYPRAGAGAEQVGIIRHFLHRGTLGPSFWEIPLHRLLNRGTPVLVLFAPFNASFAY